MPEHDLDIINNPCLGEVSTSKFLDEIEAQETENKNAALEGRTPRKVKPRERFGTHAGLVTVGPIEFEEVLEPVAPTTPPVPKKK